MELFGNDKAMQSFDELLAAAWAEQLARLHVSPGPRMAPASGEDSLKVREIENK